MHRGKGKTLGKTSWKPLMGEPLPYSFPVSFQGFHIFFASGSRVEPSHSGMVIRTGHGVWTAIRNYKGALWKRDELGISPSDKFQDLWVINCIKWKYINSNNCVSVCVCAMCKASSKLHESLFSHSSKIFILFIICMCVYDACVDAQTCRSMHVEIREQVHTVGFLLTPSQVLQIKFKVIRLDWQVLSTAESAPES